MAQFVTGEAARERFRKLADRVDAAYDQMRALSSDEVGNAFRAELAERLETQDRTNRGLMYRAFGEMADPPDEPGMAPVLVNSLAARLRIPPREVKRRMKMAGRIRARRQLSGPPLAPQLPRTAQAVQAGTIGEDPSKGDLPSHRPVALLRVDDRPRRRRAQPGGRGQQERCRDRQGSRRPY